MNRQPARPFYDAVVDLYPVGRNIPEMAYALVKFVYRIEGLACELKEAEPLTHDIRDPDLQPRLLPGSDFWVTKSATDVVVRGSAFAPYGKPVVSMEVSVSVGDYTKRVCVFGNRVASWKANSLPIISSPETFTEVPLIYAHAYGGCDARVPVSNQPLTEMEKIRLQVDHPGLYPRNPFGEGYAVLPDAAEDLILPNLENPEDLLTPERLIVGDPKEWYHQPMPWCYEYTNPLQFPRFAYLGLDAWYPPPDDDRLPEVRLGYLPSQYRDQFGENWDPTKETPSQYFQEASVGLSFQQLAESTPFVIEGMHPEETSIKFDLPREPSIEIIIEGQKQVTKSHISNLLIEPSKKQVSIVHVARTGGLPRKLIPGIHGNIPLSVIVNNDAPVIYESSATIRDQLIAASDDNAESNEEKKVDIMEE